MDDPILTPEAEKPAPTPEPSRMDALEAKLAQMVEVNARLAQMVEQVGGQLVQGQQRAQAPVQTNDEVLTQFATDPRGVMRTIAQEAVQEGLSSNFGSAAHSVFDTANRQIMSAFEAQIDYQFGEGAYAEHFKPALDRDIAQLRQINPQGIADHGTMDALVKRQYGEHFEALRERRQRLEQTAANRGLSHLIPTGGVPRLRLAGDPKEELSGDHHLFIKETDTQTGKRTDPKRWARLLHAGRLVGPDKHRTDLQDYVDATGELTKEQREKYGLT